MTDTPDWADEIAFRISDGDDEVEIAAALRKAKAAGLREAAEIVSGLHSRTFDAVKRIRAAADKLESGS